MSGMSGDLVRADIDALPGRGSFLPGRLADICDADCDSGSAGGEVRLYSFRLGMCEGSIQ